MGLFHHESEESKAYNEVLRLSRSLILGSPLLIMFFQFTEGGHKAKLSHELLAGAASFYAAKKYEEHVAKNGKPPSHALAKELLAGFAGAFIDKQIETRGRDWFDEKKAKHDAKKNAERALEEANHY
ncbi:hypothetical protein BDM02DRAFT_233402 [Thelephora ganbajun]|uniref:Uncharacterized protein n=1 Tax=Thelephora ganbajun TaxID=370292 RepID=A0ACB6ZRR6_THEGA|nr:hypothetical protein BDM02DRAFT_233402 [Thelephora ganbajun]